jgi:O-antigen/teichoic acid export membrane protein
VFILRKYAKNSSDDLGFTSSVKTLMNYGIPLYVSGILVGFVNPYQNFVLAFFAATVDIGNWKAARNFVALMSVVSIPITSALFTAFSKLDSTMSEDETVTFFKFANKYTTLLIVPIASLLIAFSNEIVQVIYGVTYQTAAAFLAMHCLLFFLVGLGYLNLNSLFNGLGETRITLKTSLISALIIFTLSPLLAHVYGVPGVITALILAYAASTCYGMYIAKRNFQIRFDTPSLIKIYTIGVAATAPSLLLLQISPLPTLVNVVVGGLLYIFIYTTSVSLAKIVSVSELETATAITQKTRLLALLVKPFLWYHKKLLNRRKSTEKSS